MPQRDRKERQRALRPSKASARRPSKASALQCKFCPATVSHSYGMAAHLRQCLHVSARGGENMLVTSSRSSSDSDDVTEDEHGGYSSGCDEFTSECEECVLAQEGDNLPMLSRDVLLTLIVSSKAWLTIIWVHCTRQSGNVFVNSATWYLARPRQARCGL